MRKSVIIAGTLVLMVVFSSCRPAPSQNTTKVNEMLAPQTVSIYMTHQQMMGKLAPNFHLNDLKGNPVSLSDFSGKPVLLTFWASWSRDSRSQMPVIQQLYEEWQNQDLVILTINVLNSRPDETEANLANFLASNNYSFPVLLDPNQLATIQYHVGDLPTNVLIDKGGFLREITPGPYLSKSAVETSLTRILPR